MKSLNRKTTARRLCTRQEFQSRPQGGSLVPRLMKQDVAHQSQGVTIAFRRAQADFDAVGEQNQPDPIVIAHRPQSKHCRQLGQGLAFRAGAASRLLAAAQIEHQNNGLLAFLHVAFDERMSHPGGHIPVDSAHVIAWLIFAHFLKRQTDAAKHTSVPATGQAFDSATSPNADTSQLADDIRRQHQFHS